MNVFFEKVIKSRDRLLETGGEYSIEDLREIGLGPEKSNGGRALLYASEAVPVNLIPHDLATALEELYAETSDARSLFQTLHSALYVYRECVNEDLEAALVKNGEAWEWPTPVLFSWKDIDAINFMGVAMGAMKKNDNVLVSIREGAQRAVTDLVTGQVKTEDVLGITGDPAKNFKFRIGKLANVRMVNSQTWQNITLRAYASNVIWVLEAVKERELNKAETDKYASELIKAFPKFKVNLPAVRYSKSCEAPNAEFLFKFL